jgi:hypothetical protein
MQAMNATANPFDYKQLQTHIPERTVAAITAKVATLYRNNEIE